jgi:hypothetical protein
MEVSVEKSWIEAIKRVLAESSASLHYTEISEQILTRGYYETDGATPAATVRSLLALSIKNDGAKSPFIRVGKGTFALKNSPVSANSYESPPVLKQKKLETLTETDVESSDSIIHSFGMYWQRDLVVWRSDQKMYGKLTVSNLHS